MSAAVSIRRLDVIGDRELRGLSDVLIDCVEGGASVSFMWPMTREKAVHFWRQSQQSAERGERAIFAAEEPDGTIVGTVQVIWAQPENQPHRADIAKMLVHRRGRRRGIGAALLVAVLVEAEETLPTHEILDLARIRRQQFERDAIVVAHLLDETVRLRMQAASVETEHPHVGRLLDDRNRHFDQDDVLCPAEGDCDAIRSESCVRVAQRVFRRVDRPFPIE